MLETEEVIFDAYDRYEVRSRKIMWSEPCSVARGVTYEEAFSKMVQAKNVSGMVKQVNFEWYTLVTTHGFVLCD